MAKGFIKIHRELKEWCYGQNSTAVHLLIFLILEANYKPQKKEFKGKTIVVKEGQLITGRKYLSYITGISESSVERWLKKFEDCGEIEQQTSTRNRLITIKKWKQFQVERTTSNTTDDTTSGQQTDTSNKGNKEKKGKNIEQFDILWSLYPRKEGKKEAFRHFQSSVKQLEDIKRIEKAIKNYLTKLDREKTEARYIQKGSTFFNNWEDYEHYVAPPKTEAEMLKEMGIK